MSSTPGAGASSGARRRPRARGRRLVAAGLVVAGLVTLAVAAPLGWQAARGVQTFGTPPAGEPAPGEPDGSPSSAESASRGNRSSEVPVTNGAVPAGSAVAPVRVRIAAIGLDAPVAAVGVDRETGEVAVPERVSTLGWYRFGAGLGEPAGSVVVAGHVDSATEGPGALFRLAEVPSGARIEVPGADGDIRTFRVVSREVFGKESVPLDRLFSRGGPPRLTLVTCGGAFDAAERSYRDNVVVTAVPV